MYYVCVEHKSVPKFNGQQFQNVLRFVLVLIKIPTVQLLENTVYLNYIHLLIVYAREKALTLVLRKYSTQFRTSTISTSRWVW
jgi:hypothetical protein